MKQILITILTAIVAMAVMYLMFAFVKAEINFLKWSQKVREFYIIMATLSTLPAIYIVFVFYNKDLFD
jgi:uncharacterized membrane-anchored protein